MPKLIPKGVAAPIPWDEGGFFEVFRRRHTLKKKTAGNGANGSK